MGFAAQGTHGQLCAGYAIAAELGRWSLETDAPTVGGLLRSTVHARIVRTDRCLLAMDCFTALRLTLAPGVTWSWSIGRVECEDDALTVGVIGRPVITTH